MPQLQLVQRTQKEKRRLRKAARSQRRLWLKYAGMRARAEMRFHRAGHHGIRVRMSRATIGEIYNHARMREALLSFATVGKPFEEPIILLAERLEEITGSVTHMRKSSELLWETLKDEAKEYGKKRKKVVHPKWGGPSRSRK